MNKKGVIILGSGRNAPKINDMDTELFDIVTLNNSFKATEKWKYNVCSCEHPKKLRPQVLKDGQEIISDKSTSSHGHSYYDGTDAYGGLQECGGTMYLCATYWAMHYLKPKVIAFLGCDMDYEKDENGETHFYGVGVDIKNRGVGDPLRDDPNHPKLKLVTPLQERLQKICDKEGIGVFNLSDNPNSKLIFKKKTIQELNEILN